MDKQQIKKQGWTPKHIQSLEGKVFVITGTTSGTGLEASRILLSKGATVIMLNRNAKKAEKLLGQFKTEFGDGVNAKSILLDLANQATIHLAAKEIIASTSRIDALICNGAIGQVPKRELTTDGFESQIGVNHFGHFTLQHALFPLIEKSKGKIVVVGSEGYKMGLRTIQFDDLNWDNNYTANAAYSQSKLAQIMSVYELQKRIKQSGKKDVKVYACHPGASRTSLIKTSGGLLTRFMWQIMKLSPFVQSAEKGAYPQLMCALEDNLDESGFYGPTGRNYWTGPVGECKLDPIALDKEVAHQLWELSEKKTGAKWVF